MVNEKGYEFLEHTADVYIAAHGKNLAEALENAAAAMFDVMTDIEKISPKTKDYVEVDAEDEYALLYSWLEALLIKFDVNGMLYSKFKILDLKQTSSGIKLKAEAWGEKYNSQKHPQKVGVKAVTYHQMEIIKERGKVTLKFILDI
ncbi:MAG: archease [Candidatus Bathyarchaeia archaeon]